MFSFLESTNNLSVWLKLKAEQKYIVVILDFLTNQDEFTNQSLAMMIFYFP